MIKDVIALIFLLALFYGGFLFLLLAPH